MTNPFEDPEIDYMVLINDEGQRSLWPAWADAPAGWRIEVEPTDRESCLAHVEANWTDMRPLSLVRAVEQAQGAGRAELGAASTSE